MKLIALVFAFTTFAAQASFIDDSQIQYDKLTKGEPQITQAIFNERINQLQTVYAPIIKQHGGKLDLKGNWGNDKIVAQATQMFGSWKIQFSGGLARRPELSADGMTLIICHEIGHHVAGFPFVSGSPLGGYWAAVEGQSDYYSTQVCARRMWENERELNSSFAAKVNPAAKEKCDVAFTQVDDQALCYRTTVGLESVIQTMAALMNKPVPQYATPDTSVSRGNMENHPPIQCRFDTLFQGSVCAAGFDDQLIPGKKTSGGREGLEAEREASTNSCTAFSQFALGLRPACWFKQRL
jgi:hypothetical protein